MAIDYVVGDKGDVIIQNPGEPEEKTSIYDPRYQPQTEIEPHLPDKPEIIPNYIPVIPGKPPKTPEKTINRS